MSSELLRRLSGPFREFGWAAGTLYVRDSVSGALDIPVSATASNNLWFGGSGSWTGMGNQLGLNPATSFSSNSQTGDPQFVSTTPGSENLRLQSNSPAKDNGTNVVSSVVKDDNDIADATGRITRPQGLTYDIGAFEFH